LGQLTLWSFKIMNDGFKGSKINSEKSDSELSKSYSIAGLIFTIPH
ncbi:18029_t:CDS:1, partial [Rhizophagus irregularis]